MTTQSSQAAEELTQQLVLPAGTALVVTGSVAREEATAYSDIDVMLLLPDQENAAEHSADKLEGFWYPLWDAKIRSDCSIRTIADCVSVMREDPRVAFALLDMRFVRGDAELAERARQTVIKEWRRSLLLDFEGVVSVVHDRWRTAGSVVDMTRPDLKHGRGGLRDDEFLRALALGQLCDAPDTGGARLLLVKTRALLHESAHRVRDILDPEFAAEIAPKLGFEDRFELSRAIASAARDIDHALQRSISIAHDAIPRRTYFALRRKPRTPLDRDVLLGDEGVELPRNTDFTDPALPIRVAACATRAGAKVLPATWRRLQNQWLPQHGAEPIIWNSALRSDFFAVLGFNSNSANFIEQLDAYGLWEPFCPEWSGIRALLPKEPSHQYTVDKHTIEALRVGAELIGDNLVSRSDLLLLALLYHDIAKGAVDDTLKPDHEKLGGKLVQSAAERMGMKPVDQEIVSTIVANHSLLSRTVRSRNPEDAATANLVISKIGRDRQVLDILAALTQADARATGPRIWSASLREGVDRLVGCCGSEVE